MKRHPDAADSLVAMSIVDPKYQQRLGHSVAELKRRVKTENRWRRLSILMLASSAFERFMLGTATAAIDSDPTLSPGFPKRVDGLLLKSHGLTVNRPDLQPLVRGAWSKRLASYSELFGEPPRVLRNAEGALEKARVLRNRIAHEFAFNDAGIEEGLSLVLGARRTEVLDPGKAGLSHQALIKLLTIWGEVSDAVDQHLTSDFIGGYETGALYLDWKKTPDAFELSAGITVAYYNKSSPERRFGNFLSQLLDKPLGNEYTRSLMQFVDAL